MQLYLNRHIIRPNQQSIIYPKLQIKGIARIKDMLDDEFKIIPIDRMKHIKNLNVMECMQYISISQCISKHIKKCIAQLATHQLLTPVLNNFEKQKTELETISPKSIYDKLLKKIIERPTSEEKLNQLLSLHLVSDDWDNV